MTVSTSCKVLLLSVTLIMVLHPRELLLCHLHELPLVLDLSLGQLKSLVCHRRVVAPNRLLILEVGVRRRRLVQLVVERNYLCFFPI